MSRFPMPGHQKGFTLAELMVALVIGLLVTAAIISLFITTNLNHRQNTATSDMQENARFAMELISQDLRHVGFLGNITDNKDINVNYIAVPPPSVDCGPTTATGKAGLYNFTSLRLVLNYGYQMNNFSVYGSCLSNTPKANSNILLMKRTAGEPTPVAGLRDNYVYIYANGLNGRLLKHPANPVLDITNGAYWEYQPRIYYIDANDNLVRESMSYAGAAPTLLAETLASGIEAFHVDFGIDTDYNGVADYYYQPAANADPFVATNTAMEGAVSATLYLLARTGQADRTYTDTKSYTLGTMPTLGPYNDNFHRRVYATTVTLKNLRPQIQHLAN